jgi:SPP1 family predicted phage head-tail adaptor
MLRHRITLQRPGGNRNAMGERETTWTDVATVCANVEPVSGRQEWLARQEQASTTHTITVRWSSNIASADASWRVKFGERLMPLDKPPIDVDERRQWLEIACTEGLSVE